MSKYACVVYTYTYTGIYASMYIRLYLYICEYICVCTMRNLCLYDIQRAQDFPGVHLQRPWHPQGLPRWDFMGSQTGSAQSFPNALKEGVGWQLAGVQFCPLEYFFSGCLEELGV